MATVTLRLPPRRAHVRTARLVAAAMARRSGVAEDLLDEVRLAVGEACARAVRLHERRDDGAAMVVEMIDGAAFELVVHDGLADPDGAVPAGEPDPAAVPPLAPDGVVAAAGDWVDPGLEEIGLALLSAMVDDIAIDTGPDGTRVRMRWPTT